ncbi:MAG: DUF427 domain-containing protein [Acidobacteria bacterium]|nr:DUF427 domain-containing protein [Acidobacteriota bacterium]
MRAEWNGVVLADSEDTIVVEGNHYFPPNSLNREYLRESATRTHCPWKGEASYYDIVAGDDTNPDAAWYYPDPSEAAEEIRDRVAFRKGVRVE